MKRVLTLVVFIGVLVLAVGTFFHALLQSGTR